MLFVGSDQPLPVREWVARSNAIFVCEEKREPDVDAIFSKRYVYAVGTRWTGDGCGFQGADPEAQRARAGLAAFLDRALQRAPELELFVAWHDFGNSGVRPRRCDWIGPSDIRTWMTGFRPDDFFVVMRED